MDEGSQDGTEGLLSEGKRELRPLFLRLYPLVLLLMVLIVAAGAAAGLERWQLFVDPAEETESVLVGAFSNLGVLMWWTTVAVTSLTWWVARRDGKISDVSKMLGAAALLTGYLAMDDLFLLHDHVFPDTVHIPEGVVLAVTMGAAGFFLWHFRKVFLDSSNRSVLAVALMFLVASLAVDAFPAGFRGQGTLEDAFKFVGIVTWLYYFATLCLSRLSDAGDDAGSVG